MPTNFLPRNGITDSPSCDTAADEADPAECLISVATEIVADDDTAVRPAAQDRRVQTHVVITAWTSSAQALESS